MSLNLTGPALAATKVPALSKLITNDHARFDPPAPIQPGDSCFPVIDHLFGPIDVIGTAPPTDHSFGWTNGHAQPELAASTGAFIATKRCGAQLLNAAHDWIGGDCSGFETVDGPAKNTDWTIETKSMATEFASWNVKFPELPGAAHDRLSNDGDGKHPSATTTKGKTYAFSGR